MTAGQGIAIAGIWLGVGVMSMFMSFFALAALFPAYFLTEMIIVKDLKK